ncbi:hypothetical protein V2G26_016426 [Clonostachys chloroleuca]
MSGRQCITRSILFSPTRHAEPVRPCLSQLRAQVWQPRLPAIPQAQIRCYAGPPSRPGPLVFGAGAPGRGPPPRRREQGPRRGRPRDNQDDENPDEELGYDRRYTTAQSFEKSGRDRLPRDHEIKDPRIMVLENGQIEGPLAPQFVMSKLNTAEESLRMIQPYFPADKAAGKLAQYPVCQIVNRKEEHLREKELKVQEKKKAEEKIKRKDVELSWGISDHDLKTKMKQIGGFLQKGMRVEIILGKKKRGKKIAREDSLSVLTQVRENLEVLGARHVKAESGEVGELVRMTVEKK